MTKQKEQSSDPMADELDRLSVEAEAAEETPISKAEVAHAEQLAQEEEIGAQQAAAMLVGAISVGVGIVAPYVDIPKKQQENVVESVAPLLQKYGIHLGGAWAVEIQAALALAGLAGGIYAQIRKHEHDKAQNDEGANDGSKREPEAA